jgi:hypothetical protein
VIVELRQGMAARTQSPRTVMRQGRQLTVGEALRLWRVGRRIT